MGRYLRKLGEVFRKGDLVLLFMCLALNLFGLLMIASTTNPMGPARYVIVQSIAAILGIFMYVLVSSIDTTFFAEHRYWLVVFNCVLLGMLLAPLVRTVMTMFLYRASAALLEPVADGPLCRVVGGYADVFSLLFTIQLSAGAMFLLLVAQLVAAADITVMLR